MQLSAEILGLSRVEIKFILKDGEEKKAKRRIYSLFTLQQRGGYRASLINSTAIDGVLFASFFVVRMTLEVFFFLKSQAVIVHLKSG